MTEKFVEQYIGIHPADAAQIELQFSGGNLNLRYVDWQESPQTAVFSEVLAFRWQEQDESVTPRDDVTYEVVGSKWLAAHSALFNQAIRYTHYNVCFNACGILDVLCQTLPSEGTHAQKSGSQETR